MEGSHTEPCAGCRAPVSDRYNWCPFCGIDLRVDLRARGRFPAPAPTQAVAAALAQIASQTLDRGALVLAVARSRRLLAPGQRKADARACRDALAACGIDVDIAPAVLDGSSEALLRQATRVAVAVAVVGALALGGVYGWRASRSLRATPPDELIDRVKAELSTRPRSEAEGAPDTHPPEVLARMVESSVAIRCGEKQGAGFFVAPNRILTSWRVLCEGGPLTVRLSSGRTVMATKVTQAPKLGLALLEPIGAEGVELPLSHGGDLAEGMRVASVGVPEGLDFTLAQGAVSTTARLFAGKYLLQVDLNLNAGSQGGPVVDTLGRVVAVVLGEIPELGGSGLALPLGYALHGADALAELSRGDAPESWTAFLEAARGRHKDRAKELLDTLGEPGLVTAIRTPDDLIWATVVTFTKVEPQVGVTVRMTVDPGGPAGCVVQGTVRRWRPVSELPEALVPESLVSLRDAAPDADGTLYSAFVALGTAGCLGTLNVGGLVVTLDRAASLRFATAIPVEAPPDAAEAARADVARMRELRWKARFRIARARIEQVDQGVRNAAYTVRNIERGRHRTDRTAATYDAARDVVQNAGELRAKAQLDLEALLREASEQRVPREWMMGGSR